MAEHLQNIKYIGHKIDDFDTFDILPDFLKDFYLADNGVIALNGGFHIRGCVKTPNRHSLGEYWFGDTKLSGLFSSLDINDIPFAQDCFGDQFVIRQKNMWRLSSETDEIKDLEINFFEFLEQIYNNPYGFLNIDNIESFDLKPGQLINVVPPFCIESKDGYSLKPVDMEEQIKYLSDFSKQIKDLPNGTNIELKVK